MFDNRKKMSLYYRGMKNNLCKLTISKLITNNRV